VLTLRLALRAIRWRAAASATVFGVAVVAILAATVGPIYLHAVDETVLARHLNDASLSERDVLVSRDSELGYRGVDWLKSEIASVEDLCVHVRIIRGRCVSGNSTGETVISAHTATAEHLTVGGTLASTTTAGVAIRLRVVGVYRPVAPGGSFWAPWGLFQFGQTGSANQAAPGDASFVTSAALSSRVQRVSETLSTNVALLPGAVTYDDIGELRTTIAHVNATVAHLSYVAGTAGTSVPTVTTSLSTILDETAHETSIARTLVTVATVQLALLAMFLLYALVANTTAAQGPEVALAKLRGRRAGSVLLQSVAQPVALVLVAAPVGALLAWIVGRLLAARLLGHPVDATFPPAAYGVAALGVLGGCPGRGRGCLPGRRHTGRGADASRRCHDRFADRAAGRRRRGGDDRGGWADRARGGWCPGLR
jgi:hypothetical protein